MLIPFKAVCFALCLLVLPLQGWCAAGAPATPAETRIQQGRRTALVIGNADYRSAPLANPVNDARAMAKALEAAGFKVTLRENLDQQALLSSLRAFGDNLRRGGTGLFYFAGHGMQIKGRNYLVPIGAAMEREDEVAYNAVDAQVVLDKMESAGNEANIVILDACRNNPFGRTSRSATLGLAPMDAPVGTLLAYATAPGMVASDGQGANGLYTQHLLNAMAQQGRKVEDVFKQVRSNVRRDSQGKQIPWESTSLEGDFYFIAPPLAPEDPAVAVELALWEAVKSSSVAAELRAYLNRYPAGRYAAAAKKRLHKLNAPLAGNSVAASAPMPGTPVAAGFSLGDRWRYQVVDKYKKEVVRNVQYKVDKLLPNGDMQWNGGAITTTAQGNFRSDANATWETRDFLPEQALVPQDLRVGFKQDVKYIQSAKRKADSYQFREEHVGTLEVTAKEKVIVPAGEFNAYRIERVTQFEGVQVNGTDRWFGRSVIVGWYVPELRNFVARDHEYRVGNKAATLERMELTSFVVRSADSLGTR